MKTISEIQIAAAKYFGVSVSQMSITRKYPSILWARNVSCRLAIDAGHKPDKILCYISRTFDLRSLQRMAASVEPINAPSRCYWDGYLKLHQEIIGA